MSVHRTPESEPSRAWLNDRGFSLIELIIVVAIIGSLVAVAIPIFISIQATAQQNAVSAAAANGATAAAASFAQGASALTTPSEAAKAAGEGDIAVELTSGTRATDVCATATGYGLTASSGPGCR